MTFTYIPIAKLFKQGALQTEVALKLWWFTYSNQKPNPINA